MHMLDQVIMHTVYVTSLSAHNTMNINFYEGNNKLVPHALLSYILSSWEFLRTLKKCEKHSATPHDSLGTSLVFLEITVHVYMLITQQCTWARLLITIYIN